MEMMMCLFSDALLSSRNGDIRRCSSRVYRVVRSKQKDWEWCQVQARVETEIDEINKGDKFKGRREEKGAVTPIYGKKEGREGGKWPSKFDTITIRALKEKSG